MVRFTVKVIVVNGPNKKYQQNKFKINRS